MNIEIVGAGFVNKGAELMLRSVIQEAETWSPGARCVAAPSVGSFQERAGAGLWQRLDLARLGPLQGPVRRRIPEAYRRQFGLVLPEEVDGILDASGFRYSDQWGAGPSRTLARRVSAATARGIPYVLLPQAFGPFADAATGDAFRTAVAGIDLVFARDVDSLAHVRGLIGDDPRVHLSPDFTAVLEPLPPSRSWARGNAPVAAVVPNYRMIDKTDPATGQRYTAFLRSALAELRRGGFEPVLVVHSGGRDDPELAAMLASGCPEPVAVVQEADARRLKGFIGTCEVVVGSRFHALVNGLTQGVPCVATGWSHKYQRLFEDYGCGEYLVDVHRPVEEGLARIRHLADPAERARLRVGLARENARVHTRIREMWSRVRGVFPTEGGAGRAR